VTQRRGRDYEAEAELVGEFPTHEGQKPSHGPTGVVCVLVTQLAGCPSLFVVPVAAQLPTSITTSNMYGMLIVSYEIH